LPHPPDPPGGVLLAVLFDPGTLQAPVGALAKVRRVPAGLVATRSKVAALLRQKSSGANPPDIEQCAPQSYDSRTNRSRAATIGEPREIRK
jgi:hypothetical protein